MIIKNEEMLASTLADLGRAMQLAGAALQRFARDAEFRSNKFVPAAIKVDECGFPRTPDQPSAGLEGSAIDPWPRIGGNGFILPPEGAFLKPAYLAKYKPGVPRLIYVGACCGLKVMSSKIGIPHNKVSTSEKGRLIKRLRELGRIRYGSQHLNNGVIVEEDGFDKWKTYRPPRRTKISENSPVSVDGPALRVVMPKSMSARQFDKRFDELVQEGSIRSWLKTDQGAAHADRIGIPPSYGSRFTRRFRNGCDVEESAKELVVFRSNDFDTLAAIIERVVLEHLKLWSSTAKT